MKPSVLLSYDINSLKRLENPAQSQFIPSQGGSCYSFRLSSILLQLFWKAIAKFFEESTPPLSGSLLWALIVLCFCCCCFVLPFFACACFSEMFIYHMSFAFSTLIFLLTCHCVLLHRKNAIACLLQKCFHCSVTHVLLASIKSRTIPDLVTLLFDQAYYPWHKLKNCYNGARKKCLYEPISYSLLRKNNNR